MAIQVRHGTGITIEVTISNGFPRATGVPLETRKVLLGHRNGDISTHYSAPELEELLDAANRVCEEKSGTGCAETKNGCRVIR